MFDKLSCDVTVFIPTYNRIRLLKNAVRSVLRQGECVLLHVLDNASTDGTDEWLVQLKEECPQVEITLRKENIGAHKNYIDGFRSVKTPYLVPLADDDELCPGFLSLALSIAKQNTALGAVIFKGEIRDQNRLVGVSPAHETQGVLTPDEHLEHWFREGHYITWSSILWSTAAVQKSITLNDLATVGLPADVLFQFQFFMENIVHLEPRSGATFNLHPNQSSRGIVLNERTIREFGALNIAISERLRQCGRVSSRDIDRFMRELARKWNRNYNAQSVKGTDLSDADLANLVRAYLEFQFPFCGFDGYPLNRLFEQRQRKFLRDSFQTEYTEANILARMVLLMKYFVKTVFPAAACEVLVQYERKLRTMWCTSGRIIRRK